MLESLDGWTNGWIIQLINERMDMELPHPHPLALMISKFHPNLHPDAPLIQWEWTISL